MERVPDWLALWRELVETHARGRRAAGHADEQDIWRTKARSMDRDIQRRWVKPDTERAFILRQLDPDATVLDIGAGTGAWAAFLARRARQVTAVEPSPHMIEVMRERLAAEGVKNVEIVDNSWPAAEVEAHDFSLCSHAMYGVVDLTGFVRRMIDVTRRTCFFVIRAPSMEGVMEEAALHIWGHPHDSPNFVVAFNALVQMGIYPNVVMGEPNTWKSWTHPTLEAALQDVKWRFDLLGDNRYDSYLEDLLRRRLVWQDDRYVWPTSPRTALMYWPGKAASES